MYLHLNPGRAKDCCCCYVSCRNKTLSDGSRNLTIWECYPRVIFYTSFSYSTSVSHQALSFFSLQRCSYVSLVQFNEHQLSACFMSHGVLWVYKYPYLKCLIFQERILHDRSNHRSVFKYSSSIQERITLCQGRLAKVMLDQGF